MAKRAPVFGEAIDADSLLVIVLELRLPGTTA
jgi:hypothetical protein